MLLLGAVLLVAVCGFVYELIIIALGTYLFGNSIYQVSIVLAAFVSAMGLGSLAAKPLQRRPVTSFVAVEAAIALVGGLSATVLYAAFAYADLYQPTMIAVASTIGLLVGCEIPLLMVLLQRSRSESPGRSVADLLAADYLGAVVGGIAFPFLLLPALGQIQSALAVGALNAVAGLVVLRTVRGPALLATPLLLVLAILGGAAAFASRFEVTARQQLFDDPIVHSERSRYQDITLTESPGGDLRLFLNGDLQFSSRDEYRYHEALVHPVLAQGASSVLIFGGGDGLALREVLRHPEVRRVVLVELDPRMLALARTDTRLARLNRSAFEDPRVEARVGDAFGWLRADRERFDAVIADFPDPDDAGTAKLYSVEFYDGIRRRALAGGGRLVIQAGSPYFAPDSFWSVEHGVAAAGMATTPYHVDVPSFGDWGFVLARPRREGPPPLTVVPPRGGRLRFLDDSTLRAAASFPPDRSRRAVDPSTLNRPRILDYERRGYRDY